MKSSDEKQNTITLDQSHSQTPCNPLTINHKFHLFSPDMVGEFGKNMDWNSISALRQTCRFFRDNPILKAIQKTKNPSWIVSSGENSIYIACNDWLFVMGKNDQGQLGLDDYLPRYSLTPVDRETHSAFVRAGGIIDVVSGTDHVLVLCRNGLFTCGWDSDSSILGYTKSFKPVDEKTWQKFQHAGGVIKVFAYNSNTAVLCKNMMFVWGSNIAGQLGVCKGTSGYVPVDETTWKLFQKAGGVVEVFGEAYHITYIRCKNGLFRCGGNYYETENRAAKYKTPFIRLKQNTEQCLPDEKDNKIIREFSSGQRLDIRNFVLYENSLIAEGSNSGGRLGLINVSQTGHIAPTPVDAKTWEMFQKAGGIEDIQFQHYHTYVICKNSIYVSGINKNFPSDIRQCSTFTLFLESPRHLPWHLCEKEKVNEPCLVQ